jgi:hypothetical protein
MKFVVVSRKVPGFLIGLSIVALAIVVAFAVIVGVHLRSVTASTAPTIHTRTT